MDKKMMMAWLQAQNAKAELTTTRMQQKRLGINLNESEVSHYQPAISSDKSTFKMEPGETVDQFKARAQKVQAETKKQGEAAQSTIDTLDKTIPVVKAAKDVTEIGMSVIPGGAPILAGTKALETGVHLATGETEAAKESAVGALTAAIPGAGAGGGAARALARGGVEAVKAGGEAYSQGKRGTDVAIAAAAGGLAGTVVPESGETAGKMAALGANAIRRGVSTVAEPVLDKGTELAAHARGEEKPEAVASATKPETKKPEEKVASAAKPATAPITESRTNSGHRMMMSWLAGQAQKAELTTTRMQQKRLGININEDAEELPTTLKGADAATWVMYSDKKAEAERRAKNPRFSQYASPGEEAIHNYLYGRRQGQERTTTTPLTTSTTVPTDGGLTTTTSGIGMDAPRTRTVPLMRPSQS